MSKQTEALKLALEALESDWDGCVNSHKGKAIMAIREALAEQPAPPPECKTDSEKTAFAFGWWKALEENRKQSAQDKEPCGWRMKHNGEWAYSFTEDAWDFIRRVPKAQQQEPMGYWQGEFSEDGGATLYEVPQVSFFGRTYPNIPLYTSPQPAQQQEPVAEVKLMERGGNAGLATVIHEIFDPMREPLRVGDKLYTSPPASKPWVGLTEEEIEKLAVEAGKATFLNDDEQTDILWFDGDCFGLARAIEAKLREKNA